MLSIKQLSKAYANTPIFNQFNANFSNKRICVVGPNGTGKSTLLCIIAGLLDFTSGDIKWHGKKLSKTDAAIASDSVIIPAFLSAEDVLLLSHKSWQCVWPQDLIDGFNFGPHLHKAISELSAGNLKKLQLINAFMRKPNILLLDEPNIALDEPSVEFLWQQMDLFEGMIIVASNEPELFSTRSYAIHTLQATQT